jgi:hypothetical protein
MAKKFWHCFPRHRYNAQPVVHVLPATLAGACGAGDALKACC